MKSLRPLGLAALLIAVAIVASVYAADPAPKGPADNIYTAIYEVADLPVYRLEAARSTFDASLIVALIVQTIAPESWDENGGHASIAEHKDIKSIVVSQTQDNHEAVVKLLRSLRKEQQAAKPSPR